MSELPLGAHVLFHMCPVISRQQTSLRTRATINDLFITNKLTNLNANRVTRPQAYRAAQVTCAYYSYIIKNCSCVLRPKVRILLLQELVVISGDQQLPLEICPSCCMHCKLTRPQECLGGLCKGEQRDVRNKLFRTEFWGVLLLFSISYNFKRAGFIFCLFKLG